MFLCMNRIRNAVLQTKFCCKFPGITLPSTTGIHKLINKVMSARSLLDKKPNKFCMLTKGKLDKTGTRLQNTPLKSLK
jgi:hypothetical protein